jgi:hypothetical protein
VPGTCISFGQRLSTLIGIVQRLGAHGGHKRYHVRYDINHDGVINIADIQALANIPACRHGNH